MELSINNVSKSYKQNKALSDFTLTFTPGVYALLGPNGSGKSTLMNIITENLKADSGSITYNGRDIKKMGAEYLYLLGYMPQYPGIYPQFTAEEYLYYIAALKGVKDPAAQITDALREVELDDVRSMRTSTFSGGMKQRLALAQAVIGDPKILLLDEPTAGLDPKQRIAVRNYISKISLDKIVIIATHVVSDIEYIAKTAIFLKKGIVADCGSPSELARKSEGKVWVIRCGTDEGTSYQNSFKVINIYSDGQDVNLRILSDTKPSDGAEPASPSLEDEYIHVFAV
ncbi:MAG: ATP-binding cassette domain-containing protein [Clostridia bacterium]|nr:ATP-binding cassette domain-containing protein [Clostridia bacterium]